mmetsp:Transcript_98948/g.280277  ORF Transcript_98948/g.280277 Transcript_98948/m.280277 type:complete len:327 (-) Transcript_98948:2581-3561(-)
MHLQLQWLRWQHGRQPLLLRKRPSVRVRRQPVRLGRFPARHHLRWPAHVAHDQPGPGVALQRSALEPPRSYNYNSDGHNSRSRCRQCAGLGMRYVLCADPGGPGVPRLRGAAAVRSGRDLLDGVLDPVLEDAGPGRQGVHAHQRLRFEPQGQFCLLRHGGRASLPGEVRQYDRRLHRAAEGVSLHGRLRHQRHHAPRGEGRCTVLHRAGSAHPYRLPGLQGFEVARLQETAPIQSWHKVDGGRRFLAGGDWRSGHAELPRGGLFPAEALPRADYWYAAVNHVGADCRAGLGIGSRLGLGSWLELQRPALLLAEQRRRRLRGSYEQH